MSPCAAEPEAPPVACPYLAPAPGAAESSYPHGLVCLARPHGARAPSADELAWLCTNGRHRACPSFRARRRARFALTRAS